MEEPFDHGMKTIMKSALLCNHTLIICLLTLHENNVPLEIGLSDITISRAQEQITK